MNILKLNKAFRSLISGEVVSYLGDVLFYPIMLILASQSSNVGLMTGLVTLSETLPKVLLLFIVSKMENVKNRFYVLCATYAIRCGIYLLIALLLTKQTDVILLVILLLNAISDIIGNLIIHTRIQYVTEIAQDVSPPAELERTFAQMSGVSQVGQQISQLAGLLIGGTLLIFVAPIHIALINAGTFLGGMVLIGSAKKAFLGYDVKKQSIPAQKASPKLNIALIFENKRLLWLIFLSGLLNVMMSLMLLFNNMYAPHLHLGGSYGTYVFSMLMVMTLGMIMGGLLMGSRKLKISFDLITLIIFSIASLYFLTLLFHQSLLLIGIAFIIMTCVGIAHPLFMGEILGCVGAEKVASIAVTLNVLMQLMTPLIIALLTISLQVIPVHIVVEIGVVVFLLLAASLGGSYMKRKKRSLQYVNV